MSFAGVALIGAKNEWNVGGAARAAFCFNAAFLAVQGPRYRRHSADTPGTHLHLPVFHVEDAMTMLPHEALAVAVELADGATPLEEFRHPERALYVFGPEDGSIPRETLARCHRTVVIPTRICLNLAAAVNIVLYDRAAKAARERRRVPRMVA